MNRIKSAREAVESLLRDVHKGVEGVDVEIRLGYIRNQLTIIETDDEGKF